MRRWDLPPKQADYALRVFRRESFARIVNREAARRGLRSGEVRAEARPIILDMAAAGERPTLKALQNAVATAAVFAKVKKRAR